MSTHTTSLDSGLLGRIEDAGINASAPPQQRLIDGWLVRFSPGKAKRARCVNAVAAGSLALAHKLGLCEQVYAEARLPMIVRVTPFTQPPRLDAALDALGFCRFDDTRVLVLPGLDADVPAGLGAGIVIQRVAREPFALAAGALRGSTLAQSQAHAERLIHAPVPFDGYVMKRDGELLACGQIAREADLVGLYDIFTLPAARGQGLAERLCRHLLADARARGALHAYLQVEAENATARRLYRRLGFSEAYAYHYRTRDPEAA